MADRGPQRVRRRLCCKDEERIALAVCLEAILRECRERRIGQRLPKFVNRNNHALACQERVSPLEQVEHDRRADRKSVVEGKSVYVRGDLGGRRNIKKKKQ